MGETPMTRLTHGLKAYGVHIPISAALPRREAPDLSAARVGAFRRSRAARGIDNEIEISRALLKRFAFIFGIEGKLSIQSPGKLRLDETVVGHVERGSPRCL